MRGFIIVLALVLLAPRAAAGEGNPCPDPGCRIKSPSTLTTERGSVLKLPPGYFLDEPTFDRRDAELRDAQDRVTRLLAENDSFRKDAAKFSWAPVLGGAITVVGLVSGVLIYSLVK